ncbi:MAG: TadE family type IV pilus minor pilin [Nocardioides sp.]|uniref:TadE family type IV pilus minor pilin n=1 Tax=Nocardioides sp. TaxID=35761 RepID=UPI003F09BFA1
MRRRDESGAVTAELAVALPLLLALTVVLVWLVSLGAAQVRVVDASREAARVVARGDDVSRATALARRIAPDGATVGVSHEGGDVVVETSARVAPPGGVLGSLGSVTVSSRAVAVVEEAQ